MAFDFDEIVSRYNTNSLKFDFAAERGKPQGLLPLWVADMDFRIPSEVAAAIGQTASHGIYGYTEPKQAYYAAISNWFEKNFGYPIQPSWVVKTPGVVFALATAVRAFTDEGDSVLIQRPVYYPFSQVILANGRKPVSNSIALKDGKYTIDFEDFEEKITQNNVRLFLLCSPHNPVGRVWTRDELLRVGEICLKHGCLVVSDEIHCDFVYPGHAHSVFPSLSPELAENAILCTSPSKTFNLAGLQTANIVIQNHDLRGKFKEEMAKTGYSQLNVPGLAACQSAYEHGESWLAALREYLCGNLSFTRDFLERNIPQARLIEPEGTYLVWLDFRESGVAPKELDRFITHEARLWLDTGEMFGDEGYGFQRVNIACPRKILEQALTRLKAAFS